MEKFSAKFRLTPYWIALFSSLVVVVGQYVMLALFINQVAVIVTSDSVVWGYIKYKYHHWGEDDTWYIYLILAGVCYVLFSATVWQLRAKARSQLQIRGNWSVKQPNKAVLQVPVAVGVSMCAAYAATSDSPDRADLTYCSSIVRVKSVALRREFASAWRRSGAAMETEHCTDYAALEAHRS
ncbi:hypothetical protein KRP22_012554 [Phytophthora ramorum]|nr:hypothetical protein KRP22_13048 [Phytophthora ramorum]